MSNNGNYYWIWTQVSTMNSDTSIRFKTSGVDRNEIHWSAEETFSPTCASYPTWKWLFDNRLILPSLLEKHRIPKGLEIEKALVAPDDGVYFFGNAALLESWSGKLKLKVNILDIEDATPTLKLLLKLTGSNCFVFFRGRCEIHLTIDSTETVDAVDSRQALKFIQDILKSD